MAGTELQVGNRNLGLRGAPRLASRLFEQVADALRADIAAGALHAGAVLRETGVAARFNVSRAPARMALDQLLAEGLLRSNDGLLIVAEVQPSIFRTAPGEAAVVAPERAWERIYGDVETALVARMSFGSWRLVESDLARHYDVSRTVAREVLGRLQQRGIVKKDQRAHWFVPGLGRDYVGELYEMRWALEPAALLNAAPHLPKGLARACLRNIDGAIARAEGLDGAALDILERELHCDILFLGRNRTMMDSLRVYQSLLAAHRYLYRAEPRLFPTEPFLPEHREVLDALVSGNPSAAAGMLERHLRVSRERAIYRIESVRKVIVPAPLPYLVFLNQD